jgi:hypothetical protein
MINMNTTSQLIDALGGTSKLAKEAGVSLSAVAQWRKLDGIPAARMNQFELRNKKLFKKIKELTTCDT